MNLRLVLAAIIVVVVLSEANRIEELRLDQVPDNSFYHIKFHISRKAAQPKKLLAMLNYKPFFPGVRLLQGDKDNNNVYETNPVRTNHGDLILVGENSNMKSFLMVIVAFFTSENLESSRR